MLFKCVAMRGQPSHDSGEVHEYLKIETSRTIAVKDDRTNHCKCSRRNTRYLLPDDERDLEALCKRFYAVTDDILQDGRDSAKLERFGVSYQKITFSSHMVCLTSFYYGRLCPRPPDNLWKAEDVSFLLVLLVWGVKLSHLLNKMCQS